MHDGIVQILLNIGLANDPNGLECNHAQNFIVRKLFQFNKNVLQV
jgi:hypothetical protein